MTTGTQEAIQTRPTEQLAAALCLALAWLIPLAVGLPSKSESAVYLTVASAGAICAAAVPVFGWLGIANRGPLIATTFGIYAGTVLATLFGLSFVHGVGTLPEVALTAGLPAAGLSALLGTAAVRRLGPNLRTSVATLTATAGVLAALGFGVEVVDQLTDRQRADQMVIELEASPLTAYEPRFEGLSRKPGSDGWRLQRDQAGRIISYSIWYEGPKTSMSPLSRPNLSVDIELVDDSQCDLPEVYRCTDGPGYTIVESEGGGDTYSVYADHGTIRLTALMMDLGDWSEGLPDAEAIGRALASAEETDWDTLLD